MLVEDEEELRRILAVAIRSFGHTCLPCASAEEAVARAAAEAIDAAVCDVGLPAVDGVELARRLKAEHTAAPLLPIILMSADASSPARLRALSAADDFLIKPLHLQELELRLAVQLRRRNELIALARANAQLRELERRKRDLTALIVHDLRAPLAGINGAIQLLGAALKEEPPDHETALSLTEQIDDLAAKALSLAASMLDVDELEQGMLIARVEEVWVGAYLTGLVRPYRGNVSSRGLELSIEADPQLRAQFDPSLVGRVVQNLLDNGVRYAARRGRVVLRAVPRDGDLFIEVGNDGPAVPDGDRDRIFDRYYQVEARRASARENRGLGLYFCRLAAEAHGGSIAVASEPALPTVFQLRLPQPPSGG